MSPRKKSSAVPTRARAARAEPKDRNVNFPEPFHWRGVKLTPIAGLPGFWRSASVPLAAGDSRTADWKVQRMREGAWYARLRVGSDRFPGRGATAQAALDDAAADARLIVRFIRAMLAKPSAARGKKKAVRR